ncbi:hypothetical protein B0J11DRAFT_492204 [Dendryphion nanum]|uniref:Conidiation-specific protein n=1 Tax=Dendryphion nanum TaxID=256645 RepID=A0A9P9IHA7_9PLEO|nr:hypothetical protein B0J11DRAFT_492204 [Dendryphion nanum]
MVVLSTLVSAVLTAGFVSAQRDPWAGPLNKPALRPNFDDLRQGLLNALPSPESFTYGQWSSGWIPEDCKFIAETWANVNGIDFDVFEVWYDDCPDQPWTFCHHRQSTIDVVNMAFQFGRLPVQMREWVRHVITAPGGGGSAFEYDGSVTFIQPWDDMIPVIIHEVAHSLDRSGAYRTSPVSSSEGFWNAYNRDTHVPDNYARTNMIENVAQNTVIAMYNENVPGGISTREPNARAIQNQYFEMINQARNAGQGNSLYNRGKSGQCTRRLPNRNWIYIGSKKRHVKGPRGETGPIVTMIGENNFDGTPVTKPVNLTLADGIIELNTGRKTEAEKHTKCDLHW